MPAKLNHNRITNEGAAFHHLAWQGFLTVAANEPARIVVLDATLPVQYLHERIYERVRKWIVDSE